MAEEHWRVKGINERVCRDFKPGNSFVLLLRLFIRFLQHYLTVKRPCARNALIITIVSWRVPIHALTFFSGLSQIYFGFANPLLSIPQIIRTHRHLFCSWPFLILRKDFPLYFQLLSTSARNDSINLLNDLKNNYNNYSTRNSNY